MISTRRAILDDAEVIANVHIQSRREAMPWLAEVHTEEETVWWIEHIVLPNQTVWVAEDNDRIVAIAALDDSTLEQLYVLPAFHCHGIGSALLQLAKDHAGDSLELWTFQRNAVARAFYERHGFTAVEFTDWSTNEEYEPDVRYQRSR